MNTVTGGGAVKWSPVQTNTGRKLNTNRLWKIKLNHCHHHLALLLLETLDSPSITVSSIDVHTKIQQELDYVMMPRTHGIVQRCDALVIGSAWILHLQKKKKR